MNKEWIKQGNRRNLVLFFNGWGMDANAIKHLDCKGYDVLMLNNYNNPKDFNEDTIRAIKLPGKNGQNKTVNSYPNIYVVAWSLGVWAASQLLSKNSINIKKAIAINGTLNPVNNNEGIPDSIFEGTLSGWSKKTRERFLMRIAGGAKTYHKHRDKFGNRNIEEQKYELASIYEQQKKSGVGKFSFDTLFTGSKDAVFTPQNQLRCWQGQTQCVTLDMPHYPFLYFNSWQSILYNNYGY